MWEQVKVYNPHNPRARRLFSTREGSPRQPKYRRRLSTWGSGVGRYEGSVPTFKSIKRHKRKTATSSGIFSNPYATRRNQGVLTDALAGEVASKVIGYLKGKPHKKRVVARSHKRRRNYSGSIKSPTRTEVRSPTNTSTEVRSPTNTSTEAHTSGNFTATVTGGAGRGANTTVHIARNRKKKNSAKRKKRNPALAVIGLNPKRKRRATMATRKRKRLPGRNAKGRFVRRKSNPVKRRRRSNPVSTHRRRRHVRATPRRRRRRSNPVRTKRIRRTNIMARRRRRRKNPVLNPRRRRRATVRHRRRRRRSNPPTVRQNRRRRYSRRRNAGGLGGFVGKIDWKAVLFVSGGVFLGDKLTGLISDKLMGATTMIPASAGPWVKLAVGVLAAGLAWKYQPAFGLGIAVGATNSLLNQYVFGPAWGYVGPSIGVAGLNDYQNRSFKMDNWIGQAAGSNLQGMGNPLLSKGL